MRPLCSPGCCSDRSPRRRHCAPRPGWTWRDHQQPCSLIGSGRARTKPFPPSGSVTPLENASWLDPVGSPGAQHGQRADRPAGLRRRHRRRGRCAGRSPAAAGMRRAGAVNRSCRCVTGTAGRPWGRRRSRVPPARAIQEAAGMFLRLVLNAVARRQLLSSDISTAARPLPAPARTGHKPVIDPVTAALMLLSARRSGQYEQRELVLHSGGLPPGAGPGDARADGSYWRIRVPAAPVAGEASCC